MQRKIVIDDELEKSVIGVPGELTMDFFRVMHGQVYVCVDTHTHRHTRTLTRNKGKSKNRR